MAGITTDLIYDFLITLLMIYLTYKIICLDAKVSNLEYNTKAKIDLIISRVLTGGLFFDNNKKKTG